MYVATKADGLRVAVRDEFGRQTGVTVIMPGQRVPDEEIGSWSYPNLVAHLNCEWVKWVGESTPPHRQHRGQVVDIRDYRGQTKTTAATPPKDNLPDVAPNQCARCGKSFKTGPALKSHTRARHPGSQGAA